MTTRTPKYVASVAVLLVLSVCAVAQQVSVLSANGPLIIHHKNLRALNVGISGNGAAPTDALCLQVIGVHCYSPQQMRHAYGIDSLIGAGFTGAGQTIVIIDSFGSPIIEQDLKTFDAAYGLPDPPSFQVIAPLGTVPFDPLDFSQNGNNSVVIPNFIDVPGFNAGVGWDAVTGWGTPNLGGLAQAIANEPDDE